VGSKAQRCVGVPQDNQLIQKTNAKTSHLQKMSNKVKKSKDIKKGKSNELLKLQGNKNNIPSG
jgi:hypothetical protein